MADPEMLEFREAEFAQLYSKMADALGVSGVVGRNPSSLLSVQFPGIAVSPGLDPSDLKTQYYISNFLNIAVECDYIATPKLASVSDVYKLILDGKETPAVHLSVQEKKDLAVARALLFDGSGSPTKTYEDYFACAETYFAAQDAYESDLATQRNGGPKVPKSVLDAVSNALSDWDSLGQRDTVNRALATITQLEGRDPYVYWQGLADRFKQHTRNLDNGSTFQEVGSLPPYADWFKQDLWSPFKFEHRDYDRQRRSGGLGMKGEQHCCCKSVRGMRVMQLGKTVGRPLLDVRGRHHHRHAIASWHEHLTDRETAIPEGALDSSLALECKFKRISILRPWMDASVFKSRLWRWSPLGIGIGITISTGGSVAANDPATGELPVLPTTALLATDIVITTANLAARKWIDQEFAVGKSVRYGPFRLQSSHEIHEMGSDRFVLATGGPQIFGYVSTIFPECPNPDLTLPWPT